MTKITAHQLYQSAEIARLRTGLDELQATIAGLQADAGLWRSFAKHYGHSAQAIMLERHGAWKYFFTIEDLKAFLGAVEGVPKDQS